LIIKKQHPYGRQVAADHLTPRPAQVSWEQAGARVIGLASEAHHEWLSDHGIIPVSYGEGVSERIRQAANGKIDAFIDTHGDG